MIETQLAQIDAALPAVESGEIPGQLESPIENVSMVSTRWGNSSRRPPRNNHAGRYNPPRNDVCEGMVAAVQEDPGVPMISCSIYVKHFEQFLCDLGAHNAQGNIRRTRLSCSFPHNYARTAYRFYSSISRRDSRTHLRMSTRLLHPCQYCGNGYGGRPWSRPRSWATFHKVRQGKDRRRKGRNPFLHRKGGHVFQVQAKGRAVFHDTTRQ